jgi:catechol 2,3-dioxygenase
VTSGQTGTDGVHLGHVHLKVRTLDRAVDFYTDVIPDLRVTERVGQFVFLSVGTHHHDLALQATAAAEPAPDTESDAVGLYHVAWELPTATALRSAYERLRERGVAVSPVDHGISKALYVDDPAGNGVELYLDTRAENDRREWQGRDTRFDPTDLGE